MATAIERRQFDEKLNELRQRSSRYRPVMGMLGVTSASFRKPRVMGLSAKSLEAYRTEYAHIRPSRNDAPPASAPKRTADELKQLRDWAETVGKFLSRATFSKQSSAAGSTTDHAKS